MTIIIYPAYFNVHYSRKEGRKVPKKLAFEPKMDIIIKALNDMGYKFEVEEDKRYPRFWWTEKGRIVVYSDEKKSEILKKIAKKIKNL